MSVELSPEDTQYVATLMRRRSAVVLDDDKRYLIETRLSQVAADKGYRDVRAVVAGLREGHAGLDTTVVEALVTHETLFFRDVAPFEVLKKEILPPLIAARAARRRLRIWSAACSSGQEPYSIAMLLLEHFPDVARSWDVRVVATDVSDAVLARARAGRYRQLEVNRGLGAQQLLRFFERDGAEWSVHGDVRRLVDFRKHNLLDPVPADISPDVIFLRNVLIYFDVPTKRSILARVAAVLPADGALVLGATETTLGVDEAWAKQSLAVTSFYRRKS